MIEPRGCLICGNVTTPLQFTTELDDYEKLAGIKKTQRMWSICDNCQFMQQDHDYNIQVLNKCYVNGYRDEKFRKESLKETFNKIMALSYGESENKYRVAWLKERLGWAVYPKMLDIGAGFGVFQTELAIQRPHLFEEYYAIEPNEDSHNFLTNNLGLTSVLGFCEDVLPRLNVEFNLISMIHVFEHMIDPHESLRLVKQALAPNGKLFIEVPDSSEFDYLNPDHDEFNSCHLWFFDMNSLNTLLTRNGFVVTDMHTIHHKQRDLTRTMAVAHAKTD